MKNFGSSANSQIENTIGTIILAGMALALSQSLAHAQQWGYRDELEEFLADANGKVTAPVVTNIREIEKRGLNKARLSTLPWSGDYWPDVKGSIADPYMETGQGPLLRNRVLWSDEDSTVNKVVNAFVRENRPALIKRQELYKNIAALSDEKIDNMSPAEKYDLLMGDQNFTLTQRTIDMVDVRFKNDLVNLGSGLCHGWSPASLTLPRPQRTVTLMTPFGRPVTFYPSDVKALASFLWGKSRAQNQLRVNGWKCQSGGKQDQYGRSADPRCFNANPAFLHLVAVNRIGLQDKGFVMDKSSNESVWNYPIYAYEIKYFNVEAPFVYTGVSFDEAKTPLNPRKWDAYRRYRSPGTKALVGVQMTIHFGAETYHNNHRKTDDVKHDKHKKFSVRYDLELGENDEIIGGEWREFENPAKPRIEETRAYTHPSIVWLVPEGVKAWSVGDSLTQGQKWNGRGIAPESWQKAATVASKHVETETLSSGVVEIPTPQPLGPVVDLLVELSSK